VQHLAQDADEHAVDDEKCPLEKIVRLGDRKLMVRGNKICGAPGSDQGGDQSGTQTSQRRTEDDGQDKKEQQRPFAKGQNDAHADKEDCQCHGDGKEIELPVLPGNQGCRAPKGLKLTPGRIRKTPQ